MKKVILFLSIFAIVSCGKETVIPETDTCTPGELCLSNLEAGQRSVYREYTSTCENFENSFQYTGNILEVEILSIDGKLFAQETYSGEFIEPIQGNPYEIYNDGKDVMIPERSSSWLFFFYGNDRITIDPQERVELKQNDCRIDYENNTFIGDEIGALDKFEVGNLRAENLTVVSCVPPLFFELDAYLMYTNSKLKISHQVSTGFEDTPITGYQLIEN